MNPDDVIKLIDYAKAAGLRSLKATVPNAVAGQPDVLIDFTFRHDVKPEPPRRREDWRP